MLLLHYFNDPVTLVSIILALLIAITCHEAAHALAADRLGDPTAKYAGRLSLNPLVHLDPIGTILLIVAGFGWGKPVPVNPNNFRFPQRDNFLVAVAGPITNGLLALVFGLSLRLFADSIASPTESILQNIVLFNLILGLFNLIPIPPLDGSKMLFLFVSHETAAWLEQYGITALLFLVALSYFGWSVFEVTLLPIVRWLFAAITGGNIIF